MPEGRAATKKEFSKLHHYGTWDRPIETARAPAEAVFVKGKIAASTKHFEVPEKRKEKARACTMGNVYFDKEGRVKFVRKDDFWTASTSLGGSRIVQARATCNRRRDETIDLVALRRVVDPSLFGTMFLEFDLL